MIKQCLKKITEGNNLTAEEAGESMREIMTGEAGEVLTGAYITALAMKGESVEEIVASAKVMRSVAVRVDLGADCIDIVGTGGDGSNSFNISTCSSFVVAAGGVPVAKHGNGSVSSKCGSADILASLGVNAKISPELTAEIFKECGYAFLHAQVYHPAMRFVTPVRRQLGLRTIFNLLGPLANPAGAKFQLLGVCKRELVTPLATVLGQLGTRRVMAVYGGDRLDEISLSSTNYCCSVIDGKVEEFELTAADFGLEKLHKSDIVGGLPDENAEIFRHVLRGEDSPYLSEVLANSATAFLTAGRVKTPKEGVALARETISSGKAEALFLKYRAATNQ